MIFLCFDISTVSVYISTNLLDNSRFLELVYALEVYSLRASDLSEGKKGITLKNILTLNL